MSEVRRVLLANGQYIEIVQETGTSTGAVMSQSAVTAALNGKANSSHTHAASDITNGTFSSARIADSSITTVKILDKAVTKAKLADDVIASIPSSSYETVTVTATITNNSTNDIGGMNVTINGVSYTFDSEHKIYAIIPYNQVYTVKPVSGGLFKANTKFQTFTASTPNRSVSISYTISGTGIFVESKKHILTPYANWNSGNNANAYAIVMLAQNHRFRMSLFDAPQTMALHSNYTDPWENTLTAYDGATGKNDLDGETNTEKILSLQPLTDYAAGWCSERNSYLPSLGEMYMVYQNINSFIDALSLCGGTSISDKSYWTSTFYGIYTYAGVSYRQCFTIYPTTYSSNYNNASYALTVQKYVRPFAKF